MNQADDLKKKSKQFFKNVALAVSEVGDFSGSVLLRFFEPENDELAVLLLIPDPSMNLTLFVTGIEEKEDEWIVSTSNKGRWALRQLPEDRRDAYIKFLKGEGYHV
jgi:hypothetical protein